MKMLVNDKDAVARLNSPINLINQLRRGLGSNNKKNDAMALFGIGKKTECRSSVEGVSKENKEDKIEQKLAVTFNPFQKPQESFPQEFLPEQSSSPTLDKILENHESQIKLGLAHDAALSLLNNSIGLLSAKLEDVRADRLPSVIAAASKTVESIRRERNEATKNDKDREVHYHFYTPEQKKIEQYEIIDVT